MEIRALMCLLEAETRRSFLKTMFLKVVSLEGGSPENELPVVGGLVFLVRGSVCRLKVPASPHEDHECTLSRYVCPAPNRPARHPNPLSQPLFVFPGRCLLLSLRLAQLAESRHFVFEAFLSSLQVQPLLLLPYGPQPHPSP